jgi:hypothetical protein
VEVIVMARKWVRAGNPIVVEEDEERGGGASAKELDQDFGRIEVASSGA